MIVRSVKHCAPPGTIRDVHARADLRVCNHERISIVAQAEIDGETTAKLDVVLHKRAHLAAEVAAIERDSLIRDVNVREREHVCEIAVSGVVVIKIASSHGRPSVCACSSAVQRATNASERTSSWAVFRQSASMALMRRARTSGRSLHFA